MERYKSLYKLYEISSESIKRLEQIVLISKDASKERLKQELIEWFNNFYNSLDNVEKEEVSNALALTDSALMGWIFAKLPKVVEYFKIIGMDIVLSAFIRTGPNRK